MTAAAVPTEGRARRRLLTVFGGLLLLAGLCGTLLVVGVDVGPVALATGLMLAVLPVPLYIALALRIDRFEPEPLRLLAWTFFWGAAGATSIALAINTIGQSIVGSEFGSDVGEIYGNSISAPIVEELAKGVVLLVLFRRFRAHFNGITDGLVYAAMVGLGFAMTENILYYGHAASEGGVPLAATFFMRGVMSPFLHPIFTAMLGLGLGIASVSPRRWVRTVAPVGGLLGAMLLHSAWNTSATTSEDAFVAVFLCVMPTVMLILLFVINSAQRREGRVVAHYLQPETASGMFTVQELFALSSVRERLRARRAVRKAGGRKAAKTMKGLQVTVSELAFQRHRMELGLPLKGAQPRPEEEFHARIEALKAELPQGMLAPPIPRGSEDLPPPPSAMPAGWSPEAPKGVRAAPQTVAAPNQPSPPCAPASLPPAAWYPDPWKQVRLRWWNGRDWTGYTAE